MHEQQSASAAPTGKMWPRYLAADKGFRNYWYPILESSKLTNKPRAIKLLGEKIVLVRDGAKVRALNDRCPHRGVPLSAGRREFPGMISCLYHGWTYDLETGQLVAALTDGPDSPICGKAAVAVRTYPVEERANLIWLYVGDEPPPPVEDDIPEELLLPDAIVYPMVELRKGDWRYAMENAVDEAHARFLHRRTPFYTFAKFPAWQTDVRMVPDESGKWLRRLSTPKFGQYDYARIGIWPKDAIWHFRGSKPRTDRGAGVVILGAARLPGIFSVGHEDWSDYQMFVPVDTNQHLMLQVSMKRTKGLGRLFWWLRYWGYIRFVHHVVLNRWEDGFIVEAMSCPPERLFRPDTAIVAWRRWCNEHARRSRAEKAAISAVASPEAENN